MLSVLGAQGQTFQLYETRFLATTSFCKNGDICLAGDFTGDGWDDIAQIEPSGNTQVRRRINGGPFVPAGTGLGVWFTSMPAASTDVHRSFDIDQDGDDDLVVFRKATGNVDVFLSTGTGFASAGTWATGFASGTEDPHVGHFDAIDLPGILRFTKGSTGDVWVRNKSGSLFASPGTTTPRHHTFGFGSEITEVGDYNGDGYSDILTFVPGSGQVYMSESMPVQQSSAGGPMFRCNQNFSNCLEVTLTTPTNINHIRTGDFDGNSADDLAVYVGGNAWFVYSAVGDDQDGFSLLNVGDPTVETLLPGDFDGNGSTDFIMFPRGSQPNVYLYLTDHDKDPTVSGYVRNNGSCAANPSACEGVLAVTDSGYVDTELSFPTIMANDQFTISSRVLFAMPNWSWSGIISRGHRSTGEFFLGKAANLSGTDTPARLSADHGAPNGNARWWNRGANTIPALRRYQWNSFIMRLRPSNNAGECSSLVIINPYQPAPSSCHVYEVFFEGSRLSRCSWSAQNPPDSCFYWPFRTGTWKTATGSMRIGATQLAPVTDSRGVKDVGRDGNQFVGLIDNVEVYNSALTNDEVGDIHTREFGQPDFTDPRLIAVYNFNDSSEPKAQRLVFPSGNVVVRRDPSTTVLAEKIPTPLPDRLGGSTVLPRLPVNGGPWGTGQGADQTPRPNNLTPSHQGYASSCIDVGGEVHRGTPLVAMKRGQVFYLREDSLDASGVATGSYATTSERLVPNCTPCGGIETTCAYPGNDVVIRQGPQRFSAYVHLQEFSAATVVRDALNCTYDPGCRRSSSFVAENTVIGLLGRSGAAGAHIHFAEARVFALAQFRADGLQVEQNGLNRMPAVGELLAPGSSLRSGTVARTTGTAPICGALWSTQNAAISSPRVFAVRYRGSAGGSITTSPFLDDAVPSNFYGVD
jgi:hypothetical protein